MNQLKKQSARAKEKLMESIGKAERTVDDTFEDHYKNFLKQNKSADKLQKDFRNYLTCIKSLMQASKTFHETLRDVYEPEWPNRQHIFSMSQSHDFLWTDYVDKLTEHVLNPLTVYCAQFGEMQKKVAKRNRKLVDFDGARNNLAAARAGNKKANEDDPKVQKAQLELNQAEKMYKDINDDLLDELPALYDSRITSFVSNVQGFLNAESDFHKDAKQINKDLCKELDHLGGALGSLRVMRPAEMRRRDDSSMRTNSLSSPGCGDQSPASEKSIPSGGAAGGGGRNSITTAERGEEERENDGNNSVQSPKNRPKVYSTNGELGDAVNPFDEKMARESVKNVQSARRPEQPVPKERQIDKINAKVEEEIDKISATTTVNSDNNTRPVVNSGQRESRAVVVNSDNVLYNVRSTHRYVAEDTDELSFEAGEVISVIEAPDPEELDEGWQWGIKETDGVKGVFPANFTQRI